MATKYRKRDEAKTFVAGETKLKIRMDKNFLNMMILYIFTKSKAITKTHLLAAKKFFNLIDLSIYLTNSELYSRIEFITKALDCILVDGVENKAVLLQECRNENDPANDEVITSLIKNESLTLSEINTINRQIKDRLQYDYILFYKEKLAEDFMWIDQNKYKTMKEVVDRVKEHMTACMNDMRKSDTVSDSNFFSLRDEVADAYLKNLYEKSCDPKLALVTGIRLLNDMLSPGFLPGRLYLILGLTGGFKSAFLMHCARWIRLYNKPMIKRRDPSSTPTVLVISAENSTEESVVRLVNMSVNDVPINNYKSAEDLVKQFKGPGRMNLKDNDVDIVIQYYANNEISTEDLYGIINDLEDDNREVVALIVDYIKRIRPATPSSDERIQLKNVSNELKTLAIKFDIPVITANQINRAGNMTIDAAAGEGKEDLARFLGRANIAVSWDLLENVDWAAIINLERDKRTEILYLTIKRIKLRYKDLAAHTYINHPFVNGSTIQLVDDIKMEKALSIMSIGSNMEGYSPNVGSDGSSKGRNRETMERKDDVFDIDSSINTVT
jgi:replicative DNA helicase